MKTLNVRNILHYSLPQSFQTPATSGVELGQQSVAGLNFSKSGQKKNKVKVPLGENFALAIQAF